MHTARNETFEDSSDQYGNLDNGQARNPRIQSALSRKLYELLLNVRSSAGTSFSGTGLLIAADPAVLPIVPLRPRVELDPTKSIRDALVEISNINGEFHDGFHVLSPQLQITRISQYFSPPIVFGLGGDPVRRLGARYMAALFGSTLPSILATGVASAGYGVVVFEHGREVNSTQ